MVIREFRCLDCDSYFESSDSDPCCPQCSAVEHERVFLTPPAIRAGDTTRKDTILKELATDYGLSDMSNKEGKAVKDLPKGPAAPSFTNQNPQVMAQLQKLGGNADNFSSIGSVLANKGPRSWSKVPAVRK